MALDVLAEVRAAVERHGVRDFALTPLSSPGIGPKGARATFRVDDPSGGVIKARRIESAEAAEDLAAIRAPLGPNFAPVLARHGSVLLEEWIHGETLTPHSAEERAEPIGALLGSLHAMQAGKDLPPESTAARRERASAQLEELVRAGVVTAGEACKLNARLGHLDPGMAPQAVVHLDFCPENLVRDDDGHIVSIDNEWISHGPPGLDLGRMYSRWPMPEPVWQRVLRGYASSSPFSLDALAFWQVLMAIWSAAIRLHRSADALAGPSARLRKLAASGAVSGDDA